MGTSKSDALAARRRAAQRVSEHMEREARALTDAVTAAMEAAELRASLTEQLAAADNAFRSSVGGLGNLGKTAEDIAALCDLPLADVRAARRTPRQTRVHSDGAAASGGNDSELDGGIESPSASEQSQLAS